MSPYCFLCISADIKKDGGPHSSWVMVKFPAVLRRHRASVVLPCLETRAYSLYVRVPIQDFI